MASLTVYRSSEISATSATSLTAFRSKRGFRVFGQGSKSVETATNHRGCKSRINVGIYESRQNCSTSSIPEMELNSSGIKPTMTETSTQGIMKLQLPVGATLAPKGFFMKKKQCPVTLLDSKSPNISSPGADCGPNHRYTLAPQISSILSESTSSEFTVSPTVSPIKCPPGREQNCDFQIRHSVSPQRLDAAKRHLGVSKLHSEDLGSILSQQVTDESISRTRTIRLSCSRKYQRSNHKLLNELLMSEDWQNKSLQFDQIQDLMARSPSENKKTGSCLKQRHNQRRTGFKFRSAVATSGLTTSSSTFETRTSPTRSKKVSFSTNVLVYLY